MSEIVKDKPVTLKAIHLQKIFGLSQKDSEYWLPKFKSACEARGVNTVLRYSGLFGQIGIESGMLKNKEENLNYSAQGLMQIFPKQFPTLEIANQYARQPEKIANRAYALKGGNRDEASGDGWRYRGRGFIQITLQQNYSACQRTGVSAISDPDYAKTDDGAIETAVWYWSSRGLNAYADRCDWNAVTKRINSAMLDNDKRIALTKKSIAVLLEENEEADIEIEPAKTNDINKEPTTGAPVGEVSQPASQRKSKYPWNWVFNSRSGHLVEVDDTPGYERLMIMHRSGSFTEISPDGQTVRKSVADDYVIVNGARFGMYMGNKVDRVSGDDFTKVGGDLTKQVGGKYSLQAPGGVLFNTPLVACSDEIAADTGTFKDLSSENIAELKARDAVHADLASEIGGEMGAALGGLSNSIKFPNGSNPEFVKPTTFNEPVVNNAPVKLASYPLAGILPPAAQNIGCMITRVTSMSTVELLFSDGIQWNTVSLTPVP